MPVASHELPLKAIRAAFTGNWQLTTGNFFMPTYEYKCDACGDAFEKFQSITSQPIRKCPKCGKNKVRRLIGTGAGMIFKGSGFYITDYRSESYNTAAKADNGNGKVATSGESKTGESKPDAKPAETKSEPKPAEAKAETKPPPKSEPKASKSAKKR